MDENLWNPEVVVKNGKNRRMRLGGQDAFQFAINSGFLHVWIDPVSCEEPKLILLTNNY